MLELILQGAYIERFHLSYQSHFYGFFALTQCARQDVLPFLKDPYLEIPKRVLDDHGNTMWRQRKMDEAASVFTMIVERNSISVNGYFRLADLNRAMGKFQCS